MITRASIIALAITCASCVSQQEASSRSASPARPNPGFTGARLPFAFERNDGQAPADYQFIGRGRGIDFRFGPRGIDIAVDGLAGRPGSADRRVTIQFAGARVQPPVGDRLLSGRVNELRGNDPSKWHRDIPTYGRVRYAQLYDGVDAVFYRGDSDIEYDLLLAPGADPSPLALIFDGADDLSTNADGDLVVRAGDREIIHRKPIAYQHNGATPTRVDVNYRLHGRRADLVVAPYDRRRALVIDPVVSASTYISSEFQSDYVRAVAVDASGYSYTASYISGQTYESANVEVAKITPDGRQFVYRTRLGGSGHDVVFGAAVDGSGHLYVVGNTESNDFPTTDGAYSRSCNRGAGCSYNAHGDAFVVKLAPDGSLVYGTFFGGTAGDQAERVTVDSSGQVHFVGTTLSSDYPVTPGAPQQSFHGYFDTVVTKLSADGGTVLFSTYYGGSKLESPSNIVVDEAGSMYIAGTTDSFDLPTFAALRPAHAADTFNHYDGFIAKFGVTGSLVFSTYLGGNHDDWLNAMSADANGIYVAGETQSTDFPGAALTPRGGTAAFVTQLTTNGSQIVVTRMLDGDGSDRPAAIDVESAVVHLTGIAAPGLPTSPSAMQTTARASGWTMFYATLPLNAANRLDTPSYLTYFGGTSDSSPAAIAADHRGGAYIGGLAVNNFPTINAVSIGTESTDGFLTHFVPSERFVNVDPGPFVTMWARDATKLAGAWRLAVDPSAAAGRAILHPDAGAAKVTTPFAEPANYAELSFNADAGGPYHLWIRGKAQKDSYYNDSVYVQLSDSADAAGKPLWRIGTTSAATIVLEDCAGSCPEHNWGWQDSGYGKGMLGRDFWLTGSGSHTVRIQTREDGLAIDQIVVSKDTYLHASPGTPADDTLVLPVTVYPTPPPSGDACTAGEVVLYASTPTRSATWTSISDQTAAGGMRIADPDRGAPKLTTALASPAKYFELEFAADATVDYRLWIRGKAEKDYWGNDSVFVQFGDSVSPSGTPAWRIGTTAATEVNLEECSGCGVKGWGWQDNGWGVGVMGALVRFATSGTHTIRVQTREDGFSIDQIVLSSGKYVTASPGALKSDTAILPRCANPPLR